MGANPGQDGAALTTVHWNGPDIPMARTRKARVRADGRVWASLGRPAEFCQINGHSPT